MDCISAASEEEKVKSSSTEQRTQEATTSSPEKKDSQADEGTLQQQEVANKSASHKSSLPKEVETKSDEIIFTVLQKKHEVNEFE